MADHAAFVMAKFQSCFSIKKALTFIAGQASLFLRISPRCFRLVLLHEQRNFACFVSVHMVPDKIEMVLFANQLPASSLYLLYLII